MALYDMTGVGSSAPLGKDALVKVTRSSFAALKIQERAHLQAALRDHIALVGDGLLVVAEEFGDFDGASRRIDLLCVDRSCRLVVVELKRTADGGHMELQALRYAAMVSTMTFPQLVRAFAKYRKDRGFGEVGEEAARVELVAWLDEDGEVDPVVSREVGIVLVSEDFSQEITTTVLWLNEFHGFDVRCVRLSPYVLGDRVLLDVQQVIPLPEAAAYTVRVRAKESGEHKSINPSLADFTRFVVTTPSSVSKPLPKRWAMLELVAGLASAGVGMDQIRTILPASKILKVDGEFDSSDDLWDAIQEQLDKSDENRRRWHLEDPIAGSGHTWVLNNNWGAKTREQFKALLAIAPHGFAVEEEDTNGTEEG